MPNARSRITTSANSRSSRSKKAPTLLSSLRAHPRSSEKKCVSVPVKIAGVSVSRQKGLRNRGLWWAVLSEGKLAIGERRANVVCQAVPVAECCPNLRCIFRDRERRGDGIMITCESARRSPAWFRVRPLRRRYPNKPNTHRDVFQGPPIRYLSAWQATCDR